MGGILLLEGQIRVLRLLRRLSSKEVTPSYVFWGNSLGINDFVLGIAIALGRDQGFNKEKSMRSSLFVTTAVLGLAFASVAQAQYPDRNRSDRYDDRYQDRYDERYRGDSRSERVAEIAHEIENTAAAIHREYERNNRRPNRNEARVAGTLHELHEQADRFHREIEGYRRDSQRSTRGYDGLLRAFDDAAYSLDSIRQRPYVDRGMERIWNLMSELERYYGRRDRQGRGYNRYDRRDGSHGRYRNDDDHH